MYLARLSSTTLLALATSASALNVFFFPSQTEVCDLNGGSRLECRGLLPGNCCGPILPPYGAGIAYNNTANDRALNFAAYGADTCFSSPAIAEFSCGGGESSGSCCTELGVVGNLSVSVAPTKSQKGARECQQELAPNVLVYVDEKNAQHEVYLANEDDQRIAIEYLKVKDFGQLAKLTPWSGQKYDDVGCGSGQA